MTDSTPRPATMISRRGVLRRGALVAGGAAIAGGIFVAAPASAKISQKGVSYQATPQGAARCDNCGLWQAPAACKSVDGVISSAGWCTLYTPK